jgi:small ligand-binding sensory domain FIST
VLNGFEPHCALVHADANTPDLADLIQDVTREMQSGFVFGGLTSSRAQNLQFALSSRGNLAGQAKRRGVLIGGMSGVAFSQDVCLITRVTQGCVPTSKELTVTKCEQHLVLELDGQPALDVLWECLGVEGLQRTEALNKVKQTLVALSESSQAGLSQTGHFQEQVMVRHIIGLDPKRNAFAVAQILSPGMRLSFCERNTEAAKADLMRIGAEVRESLEPEELSLEMAQSLNVGALSQPHLGRRILGAIYISCAGRGGPHFGAQSAELQILRRSLGDVPLLGFFASGEIAHHHLYGYTGVLTVFVDA